MDTRGPEIRTCYLVDGPDTRKPVKSITLKKGETVVLAAHDPSSNEPFHGWKTSKETRIAVNYMDLGLQVLAKSKVLLADGNIQLEIKSVRRIDGPCGFLPAPP